MYGNKEFTRLENEINDNINNINKYISTVKNNKSQDESKKLTRIIQNLESKNLILENSNKQLIDKFTNLKIQISEIKNKITNYLSNIKSLIK